MKNKELYDIVERTLGPSLNVLGFQHQFPPRANWFRQIRTRYLRLLIEVHNKTRWLPHLGGAFNCWIGFADSLKHRALAPEDSFSFDSLLNDPMLKSRREMRNRVIRKIISIPGTDEMSLILKTSSDELFRLEMQGSIHRNSGGLFRFYDAEDVEIWCNMILEMLPHINRQAEARMAKGLVNC